MPKYHHPAHNPVPKEKIRPKKSLGQHFLTSAALAAALTSAAAIKKGETVLEIGPGTGILTAELLKSRAGRVLAVEKDKTLLPLLEERFVKEISADKLSIIEADISSFDPQGLQNYKVAANIPYYLTGEILRKFLSHTHQPLSMTLMLQREVTKRILAKNGKESLLSLSVKAYGKPSLVRLVSRGSFHPPPKVESAILHIGPISRRFFRDLEEKLFFKLLKAGFAHRRKMLISNLSKIAPRTKIREALARAHKGEKVRAEELNLEDWRALALFIGRDV